MPDVTILCPFHGKEENLSLPDSYKGGLFVGDVPCGGGTDTSPHATLHVEVGLQSGRPPRVLKIELKR